MFACAVGVGQATTRLDLSQAHLLAGYTLLAVVATFLIDMYSGFILAAIGLVIGLHILGGVGHYSKVVAGDIMLIAGIIFCGYNGPSGGIRTSDGSPALDNRRYLGALGLASDYSRDQKHSKPLK